MTELFTISNSATKSFPAPSEGSERRGFTKKYLFDQSLGLTGLSAGVFATIGTLSGQQELSRRMVVDQSGVIEQFAASNVSLVMAQSIATMELPRVVSLKQYDLRSFLDESQAYVVFDPVQPFRATLDQLAADNPEINFTAFASTEAVLIQTLRENVSPSKILSGPTGIFIYFVQGTKYAEIECDNDGDISVVMSDRTGAPQLWFTTAPRLSSDLNRIRAFLV